MRCNCSELNTIYFSIFIFLDFLWKITTSNSMHQFEMLWVRMEMNVYIYCSIDNVFRSDQSIEFVVWCTRSRGISIESYIPLLPHEMRESVIMLLIHAYQIHSAHIRADKIDFPCGTRYARVRVRICTAVYAITFEILYAPRRSMHCGIPTSMNFEAIYR